MLIEGCKKGYEDSWRQLFEAYYPLAKWIVVHTIYQLDPQEVNALAQEGMIAVVENTNRIKDEQHLKRYLKMVTRNKCIDFIRKNKHSFDELDVELMSVHENNFNETVIIALEDAMENLQEPCNSMVKGRFLDGMSYNDIAIKVNIKKEQIGTRLGRCLRFLRTYLESKGVSWEDVL